MDNEPMCSCLLLWHWEYTVIEI